VVEGIIYAVSRGAKVLNLSIGTLSDSAIVHDAIRYAVDHGVTVVAASGNDGQNTVLRPAAYDEVICVGAVDGDLDRAQFSNYGDEVDIVAPGVGVATAGLAGRRIYFSGTSAAAPFVSGALAALRARFPQLSVAELRARLLDNANNLGAAGRDPYFGAGILRLDRAMRSTFDRVNDLAVTSLYFDPPAPRHGEHVTVYFVVQNQGTESITGAQWRDSIDGARSSMTLPMLKPGACYEIRRSWTVPPLIGDGGARIEGTVRCSATETSLRNNGKAITLYNPAQ
jgi:subtilisin family serine protease